MEKIPVTKPGFDKMNAELKHLKSVESALRLSEQFRRPASMATCPRTQSTILPRKSSRSSRAASRNWRGSSRWPM